MKKIILTSLSFITLSVLFITSCVKKDFDNPPDPSNIDPGLTVTSTVLNLKSKFNVNSPVPVLIDSDLVISGIVVADDRGGNFYKQIVVQDASSGIAVNLGRSGLYNDYPTGRKIYIKCKGLYLGAYGKFIQLGATPDASGSLSDIPSSSFSKYIVKANYPNPVVPKSVTISQLASVDANSALLGTLIQLDSVQFIGPDRNVAFAEPATIASGTDRKLEDCAGNSIVSRVSGYASFQSVLTPTGRGNFIGIYSRYNGTAQLLMRDTMDAQLKGSLCGGNTTQVSIQSIRQLFAGGTTAVPFGTKISGVVISDKSNSNVDSKNLIVQDGGYGITVRFSAAHTFNLNDVVEIDISGQTLSEFPTTGGGVLQVGGTSFNVSKATKLSSGGSVTARVATLKALSDSLEAWESSLIKVNNVTLTHTSLTTYGTTTAGGELTMNDGSGASMLLYTAKAASFISQVFPVVPSSITGILGQYQAKKQISIRNTTDVQ